MSIRFSNDDKYSSMIRVIEEFDQVYLKSVADILGLNYEKIR